MHTHLTPTVQGDTMGAIVWDGFIWQFPVYIDLSACLSYWAAGVIFFSLLFLIISLICFSLLRVYIRAMCMCLFEMTALTLHAIFYYVMTDLQHTFGVLAMNFRALVSLHSKCLAFFLYRIFFLYYPTWKWHIDQMCLPHWCMNFFCFQSEFRNVTQSPFYWFPLVFQHITHRKCLISWRFFHRGKHKAYA